jgi:hypothetical protein
VERFIPASRSYVGYDAANAVGVASTAEALREPTLDLLSVRGSYVLCPLSRRVVSPMPNDKPSCSNNDHEHNSKGYDTTPTALDAVG